jgi:hypothetical protein
MSEERVRWQQLSDGVGVVGGATRTNFVFFERDFCQSPP